MAVADLTIEQEPSKPPPKIELLSFEPSIPPPYLTIPYYHPWGDLPAFLPGREEIESCPHIVSNSRNKHRRTILMDADYVVKYGKNVNLAEGQNMLFLAENSDVPVPVVYAMWRDESDGMKFIVMENVRGESFGLLWPILSEGEKGMICEELKIHLESLRVLPSPGGYCSIGHRPLLDKIFWNGSKPGWERWDGPFEIEGELNEALFKKILWKHGSEHKAEFLSWYRSGSLSHP